MVWAVIVQNISALFVMLAHAWNSWRERQTGQMQARLAQEKDNEAAVAKAHQARLRRLERDLRADGVFEDDGFRRD